MRHTEMINRIIGERKYTSYLEIGLGTGKNFQSINVKNKTGVDPEFSGQYGTFKMRSDQFFREANAQRKFDFIFIDGLHHYDQVLRDVNNSLKALNEGGAIMVHDCNPPNRESQIVPRQTKIWTGDVWKAWVLLRRREDIHQVCINDDYGCGMIERGKQRALVLPEELGYEELVNNRKLFLNLVTWEQYERTYL